MGSVIAYPVMKRCQHNGPDYRRVFISWHTDRWDAAGKWTGCGAHIRLKIAVAMVRRPGDSLEVDSE